MSFNLITCETITVTSEYGQSHVKKEILKNDIYEKN